MDTKSVVERPVSITDWTCPMAPNPETDTHHMVGGFEQRCQYCRRNAADLRTEQAAILAGGLQ